MVYIRPKAVTDDVHGEYLRANKAFQEAIPYAERAIGLLSNRPAGIS